MEHPFLRDMALQMRSKNAERAKEKEMRRQREAEITNNKNSAPHDENMDKNLLVTPNKTQPHHPVVENGLRSS